MAMEIPVVSTAVAGVTELIEDGKDGILCPVRDVAGLAEAVIKVLGNQKLRQNLAHTGRKRIEVQFNFADRVRALEEIYCRVAGAGIEKPAILAADGN
jgi:glycosyltransferase involved in cell wall biosynthesis